MSASEAHPDDDHAQPARSRRDCDVLVVGAGPAGSAAARWLALRGLRVVLADRRTFPRDKVCGDGLIADALEALGSLGLRERMAQRSVHVGELHVHPPVGRPVSLGGDFACMPRHDLDLLLWEAAIEAGAIGRPGLDAVQALESGGRVIGARFQGAREECEVHAGMTILATGANSTALAAFGLRAPGRPSAVAGRAYFEAPAHLAAGWQSLVIAYDREWSPGYGWIFPSPGNRFNIGVGLFTSSSTSRLREFWGVFTTRFVPAARIVRESSQLTPFRGAPIRAGLTDAAFGRPGLLAVGEAAATTYSATGEGIGKALESGMMAAAMASACLEGRESIETAHERYGAEFRARFQLRYRAYDVAQAWAAHPFVLSILAARTRAGRFARGELEALIAERGDLRRLFSVRGLFTALVR
jgi:geranylgeranyl reductase family protein